jgi:sugar/nucleoside kinase (ribokinase family)
VTLRIVVVGDVMLDVVVKPAVAIAPTSDTPSRFECTAAAGGELRRGDRSAGHRVTYVGASGTDLAAQLFEDDTHDAGVETAVWSESICPAASWSRWSTATVSAP